MTEPLAKESIACRDLEATTTTLPVIVTVRTASGGVASRTKQITFRRTFSPPSPSAGPC